MKMTKNILAILLLLIFISKVFADSPITSTEFYKKYSTEIIIKEDYNNGILIGKIKIYLANPLQQIDVKMALINRLRLKAKEKKNSKSFIR